eukprot:CAMPEP_0170148472 /NCGR_PEP_ID=MMETSP0033_2-20121228/39051_1 /TAXON_ID=195969 /ORGANISM="Dolichomastix tenuilepis, Strain CCMP3274" /LENGTH=390 /DNA_ID=CAMNT_0010385363 /DNA_START=213 /DNA_END=1384 /DNA_ORIENTATION=+
MKNLATLIEYQLRLRLGLGDLAAPRDAAYDRWWRPTTKSALQPPGFSSLSQPELPTASASPLPFDIALKVDEVVQEFVALLEQFQEPPAPPTVVSKLADSRTLQRLLHGDQRTLESRLGHLVRILAGSQKFLSEADEAYVRAALSGSPSSSSANIKGAMDTGTFRTRLAQAGCPVESTVHVCHIIGAANGGFDGAENYYLASGPFNQQCSNTNDDLQCFLVGRPQQVADAIAASICHGSTQYPGRKLAIRPGETPMAAAERMIKSGRQQLAKAVETPATEAEAKQDDAVMIAVQALAEVERTGGENARVKEAIGSIAEVKAGIVRLANEMAHGEPERHYHGTVPVQHDRFDAIAGAVYLGSFVLKELAAVAYDLFVNEQHLKLPLNYVPQ